MKRTIWGSLTAVIIAVLGLTAMKPKGPNIAILQQAQDSVRVIVTWSSPASIRGTTLTSYNIRARAPHLTGGETVYNTGNTLRADTVWVKRDTIPRTSWWSLQPVTNPAGPWAYGDSTSFVIQPAPFVSPMLAPTVTVSSGIINQADSVTFWPERFAIGVGDTVTYTFVGWFADQPTTCLTMDDGRRGWGDIVLVEPIIQLEQDGVIREDPCAVSWSSPDPTVVSVAAVQPTISTPNPNFPNQSQGFKSAQVVPAASKYKYALASVDGHVKAHRLSPDEQQAQNMARSLYSAIEAMDRSMTTLTR